jgi:hypothetical protein
VLCWPAEVLAVQGHQEQGQTHDVKHLVEDVGKPAQEDDGPHVVEAVLSK